MTVDIDGMVLSRFVWRGEMWTDDPVLWHTATIRCGGFRSYNFFNIDLTDINHDRFECNEYDFIIDYTFPFGDVTVAPGVLHFSSPTNFFEPTTKITLQIKSALPFNPGLRIRVDPEKSSGSYFIFDFSNSFKVRKIPYPINLYGSIGASQPRYYRSYLDDQNKLTDILIGFNIPIDIGYGLTLSPAFEFTSLVEKSVRKAQEENHYDKDAFTYLVRIGRQFSF
ncbi:hypothetical protein ACFL6H_07325 [Candidatus Latescibacterota bacterium]